MSLPSVRSFSDELQKIRDQVFDSDMRELQADRDGEEFLEGGRIRSNGPSETNFTPKLAASYNINTGMNAVDFDSRKKGHPKYEKHRDNALATMKGGLAGGAMASLYHNARGSIAKPHHFGIAAGVGAASSLADHLHRHKGEMRNSSKEMVKKAMKGSGSFSPGRELSASSHVASFENKIHKPALKGPVGMGKDFRMPKL